MLRICYFFLHYNSLIKYEEVSLNKNFREQYRDYITSVPRLMATPKSIYRFIHSTKHLSINRDGFRHNALYLLFIPGFIIAAITNHFSHALVVGIPGLVDWAIVHTRIGLGNTKNDLKDFSKPRHQHKKVFNDIIYAQCWEDPSLDRIAFNIQPNDYSDSYEFL